MMNQLPGFAAESYLGTIDISMLSYEGRLRILELAEQTAVYMRQTREQFRNPADTRRFLQSLLGRAEYQGQEVFMVIFLDSQHGVLASEEMFRGTIDSCAVYPRLVVKRALEVNAAAVVFAHNHPSGLAEPSQADRTLTDRLKQALGTVDVRVVDHIVVGGSSSVSFAERGWL